MKKLVLIALVVLTTVVVFSSCGSTRSGCIETRGLVGYR